MHYNLLCNKKTKKEKELSIVGKFFYTLIVIYLLIYVSLYGLYIDFMVFPLILAMFSSTLAFFLAPIYYLSIIIDVFKLKGQERIKKFITNIIIICCSLITALLTSPLAVSYYKSDTGWFTGLGPMINIGGCLGIALLTILVYKVYNQKDNGISNIYHFIVSFIFIFLILAIIALKNI